VDYKPATGSWPLTANVEAAEKVNLARVGRVGRKCDISGCSVYNDFILAGGQEIREKHVLMALRGFFYRLVGCNRHGFT
jgi:hypothetical protein